MKSPTLSGTATAFITPISDRARANLIAACPDIPFDDVAHAVEAFQIARAGYGEQATPTEISRDTDSILSAIDALCVALSSETQQSSMARVREFLDFAARSSGGVCTDEFERHLHAFKFTVIAAQQRSPRGRRIEPKQVLAESLTLAFARAGLEVSARPQGPLNQVIEIVLGDMGITVADPRSLIRPAVEAWELLQRSR